MIDTPVLNVGYNEWMRACPVCGLSGWAGMQYVQIKPDPDTDIVECWRGLVVHRSCGLLQMRETSDENG